MAYVLLERLKSDHKWLIDGVLRSDGSTVATGTGSTNMDTTVATATNRTTATTDRRLSKTK
jgi:hypothetical protein